MRRSIVTASIVAAAISGCSIDPTGTGAFDGGRVTRDGEPFSARDAAPGDDAFVMETDAAGADAATADAGGEVDACVLVAYHPDGDRDGHGAAGGMVEACEPPSGYVESANDCDDANAAIHPGAPESCDGVDQSCDGLADEGADCAGCEVRHQGTRAHLFCNRDASFPTARGACPPPYAATTIDDAGEDAWVASNARGIRATGWWIGYHDLDEDDRYGWVAGASTYEGWGPDEPSGGSEHCTLIAWYGTGASSWNDGDCAFRFPFVCEITP